MTGHGGGRNDPLTRKGTRIMINHRHLAGLAVAAFLVAFALTIGGLVVQCMGSHNTGYLVLSGIPFNFIGVLAAWSARAAKDQSDRLDRLEAAIRSV
jgi:hypothetical protein